MDDPEILARLDLALAAAREAGELTLRHFDATVSFDDKADGTPVTAADRASEELLRRRIEAAFPNDGIWGEEHGTREGTSGFRWLIDPIDGTKSFIRGVPLYGVLVGIEHRGRPAAGVVELPATGETLHAARGRGAWHRRAGGPLRPARVSQTATLADATFCTTSPGGFLQRGRWDAYERLCHAAKLNRGWGDCYGYALVATGRADIMIDARMSPWCAAACAVVLEEAGGRFTDWQGNATIHGREGVGTNAALHEATLALLR